MTKSVVTIGEAMIEFSMTDDGLWRQGFAGDTLNVAWAMRALLPEDISVRFLSRIGVDSFSCRFRQFIGESGINDTLLSEDAGRAMGLYTIETDEQGERSFSYWRENSAARKLAENTDDVRAGCQSADLVYFSGITLAILPPEDRNTFLEALGKPGERKFRVAFDPNYRPRLWHGQAEAQEAITAAAGISDIVLPTFEDEAAAFGDKSPDVTMNRYREIGVKEVIVKDGVQPTLFAIDGEQGELPVRNPVRPVDTTGAGDSFNGAYLAGRLNGLSPAEAVRLGQSVSKSVVGYRGALVDRDVLAASSL